MVEATITIQVILYGKNSDTHRIIQYKQNLTVRYFEGTAYPLKYCITQQINFTIKLSQTNTYFPNYSNGLGECQTSL